MAARKLGTIDVDFPWKPDEAHRIAQSVIDVLSGAVDQAGPDFEISLNVEQAQFVGKAMVIQLAMVKMMDAEKGR